MPCSRYSGHTIIAFWYITSTYEVVMQPHPEEQMQPHPEEQQGGKWLVVSQQIDHLTRKSAAAPDVSPCKDQRLHKVVLCPCGRPNSYAAAYHAFLHPHRPLIHHLRVFPFALTSPFCVSSVLICCCCRGRRGRAGLCTALQGNCHPSQTTHVTKTAQVFKTASVAIFLGAT